ncbi:MAG: hypothetical protein DCF19_11980 [Pseudanabaena frigida]|uniref:Uncharacterized protein n=1 Tax=Pseudanabaena frigida TaxID=945775 RepID=A0A2W4W844_9CYAN|nr:MAG: hypothetical protein DCF19_11980 [Pseudanabaena frigida]
MVSRKVIHINLLKAAYINVTKNKSRKGEITSNHSVTLLTDSGEIELSESYSELAQQEVDRINYFINSSQPSLYIREEHLKDARNIFKIFGIIGLVFGTLSWLAYINVIS